jgi:preprotein translocase subunit SecF
MEFFPKVTTFPFMHTRKVWYAVSATLVVASLVLFLVRGLNLGIDFTGGVVLELAYPGKANIDGTRSALDGAGFHDAQVQAFGTDRDVMVRLPPQKENETQIVTRVVAALKQVEPGIEVRNITAVGGQVGDELKNQGGLAVLFTFVLIGIYTWFRFEKKMGMGAVLAALHDPLLIIGFFAATQIPFDLASLAAILAVIGYSLNDTVVVFDRVRDNFSSMRRAEPSAVLDAAINQTLSRTVITSGATLLVVVVLLIMGGPTLRGFSWALTIGIVVGTYSSIYVASAIALDMKLSAADLMPPQKDSSEIDALP